MAKKQDFSVTSYVFGVLSIVLAFFQPLAGIVLGILGITQSKKQKTELSKKAKILSTIGIIIGIIVLTITFYFVYSAGGLNIPAY